MGADESIPIPPPPSGFEYFVLSLTNYMSSKIRTIFANQNDLAIIRNAIFQNWGQGIEEEKPKFEQSWSFHLRGYPFSKGSGAVQAACARKVFCQILQNLHNSGLELKIYTDLTRRGDLTTMLFCRTHLLRPIQYPLICIGLSSTDKLQLVNVPENILTIVRDVITRHWARGIQSEGAIENAYEFKFSGNPWFPGGSETVQGRLVLALIIASLAQQYWVFHGAANLKGTSDNMFFRYDPQNTGPLVNHHFVLSLNDSDKLRLINAPQEIIPVVQQTILSTWSVMGGIQREQEYYGSWEFKMSGNPWYTYGTEAVMARFLICKILEALQGHGWTVKATLDVSRSSRDKSSFVLAPSQLRDTAPVMCLSFSDSDKVRLINAPQDLTNIVRDILMTRWTKGIAREEQMRTHCIAHEFKLNGNPLHGLMTGEALHIRAILCYVLQAFTARGWRFLASADVSARYQKQGENGPEYPVDVHSWWFVYQPGQPAVQPSMQPSAPFMPSSVMPPPPSYQEVFKS